MKPFDYVEPRTVEEAVAHLAHPGSRCLAGGTDLLVRLSRREWIAERVVNLKRIESPSMRRIAAEPDWTSIGSLATLDDLARSDVVAHRHPVLVEAALLMASPQVRHLATVGGNLCNASPAADLAPPLLCLRAVARIAGPRGWRDLPMSDFFRGPGRSALEPDEVLVSVRVPAAPGRGTFLKFSPRRAMDLAIVNVAAFATDGEVRLALGAVAPTPILVPPSPEGARDACSPIDDHRASAAYRRHLAWALCGRALRRIRA